MKKTLLPHFIFLLMAANMVLTACSGAKDDTQQRADRQVADSLTDHMYELYDNFDFAGTIEVGLDALHQYKALNNLEAQSDVMATLCVAYLRLGRVSEGLEMSKHAIEVDSILNDAELLSSDYNTIASLYLSEDKPAQAEPFILKAIEYELQTSDHQHLSNRYGIASEIYCKAHKPELALDYAQKGLAIAEEQGDSAQMGTRLSQLGDAYLALGRMEDAEQTFKRCVEILRATQSAISLAITYRQLGNIYENANKKAEAITYYEKASALARQTHYNMLLCQCTQAIGEISADDNPTYAVEMLKESRALADTLHSKKVEELMADYATKFNLSEKQHTIDEQAAKLKIHRIATCILVVATVVALLLLALMFYTRNLRRRGEELEVRLSEKVVQETQHHEPEMNNADREFLNRLAEHVEKHLAESDLSSTTIAEAFCLSPRQFSRRVKQLTSVDTTHYIRASRIVRARKLLTQTDLPIQDIYIQCGFESANYFARIFRSDVGLSPTEYRKKMQENN